MSYRGVYTSWYQYQVFQENHCWHNFFHFTRQLWWREKNYNCQSTSSCTSSKNSQNSCSCRYMWSLSKWQVLFWIQIYESWWLQSRPWVWPMHQRNMDVNQCLRVRRICHIIPRHRGDWSSSSKWHFFKWRSNEVPHYYYTPLLLLDIQHKGSDNSGTSLSNEVCIYTDNNCIDDYL